MQCGICLETIKQSKKIMCNHTFCKKCINKWYTLSNKCPICRTILYKKHKYNLRNRQQSHNLSRGSRIRRSAPGPFWLYNFNFCLSTFNYNNINTRSGTKYFREHCFVVSCRHYLKAVEFAKNNDEPISNQLDIVDKIMQLILQNYSLLTQHLMGIVKCKINDFCNHYNHEVRKRAEVWRFMINEIKLK